MKIRFFLSVFLFAVFLVGCGADIDQSVTFYRDEEWEAEINFSIEAESLALIGSPDEIAQELDSMVEEAKKNGAKASWSSSREGTTLIYTIQAEGKGLDMLSEIVFDGDARFSVPENEGEGQIQIYYSAPLTAGQYTLTLTGGRIVSGNGQQIDNHTMQWINPSSVEAVLTEKSRLSLGLILFELIVLAGVAGGGWFVWQKQSRVPIPIICTNCGQPLTPQAQFCHKCGQKRIL